MLLLGTALIACTAATADKVDIRYDDGGSDKTTVIGLFRDNGQSYHQRVDFAIPRTDGLLNTRLSLRVHVGSQIEPAAGESEAKVGLRVNGGEWHWQPLKPYADDKLHWIEFDIPAQEWRRGLNTVETTSTIGSFGNMTPRSLDMIGSGAGRIHYRSYHSHDLAAWRTMPDRNWCIRLTYEQERLPSGQVRSLSVEPRAASISLDENAQFVLEARDADGRMVDPGPVEWSASRGFIDEYGFFHPETDGRAEITAKVGALTARATCDVELRPPVGVEGPASAKRLRTPVPEGHIDLNGTWQFRRDERGVGESEDWFSPDTRTEWGDIHVPGSWQAQGWGLDYHGIGWYRRTFGIPKSWNHRRVHVVFEAVATHAKVWMNGRLAGEHTGNWSPFELDITDHVRRGGENTLTVRVEELPGHTSAGFPQVVGMHFGGIWQNVSLRGTGPAWLDDAAAFPDLARKVVEIEAEVGGEPGESGRLVCVVTSPDGTEVARQEKSLRASAAGTASLLVAIPDPKPWSPDSPALYRARIELWAGGELSDAREVRFGMRDVAARGAQVLLNGKPISVRGMLHWGNYPHLISIDPSEEQIRNEFPDLRAAGFNLVKVCLFMMPRRFYEIADETGMMVWQEYPTWQTFPQKGSQAPNEALVREYEEWIRLDRNHPSVILRDLTCESPDPHPEFMRRIYDLTKRLTRGALVEDNSAYLNQVCTDFYDGHLYREVDVQFTNLENNIAPWLRTRTPVKPYLTGEDMDCDTYRDIAAVRKELVRGPEMPWWLANSSFRLQEAVEQELSAVYGPDLPAEMVRMQNRRALVARKALFEEYRRHPELTGYVMTHIFDNPLTRPGFYDDLGKPKWKPEEWRRFNDDRVLILYSPRRSFCFEADEAADLTIELSNYGDSLSNAPLKWRLESAGKTLAHGEAGVTVARGEIVKAARLELRIPELAGTYKPISCRFIAEMDTGGEVVRNDWPVWVFPASDRSPRPKVLAYSPKNESVFAAELARIADAAPFAAGADYRGSVIVTDCLDSAMAAALADGARVVYIARDDDNTLPRRDAPFWREMAIRLPPGHPMMGDFPHEGFVDLQFVDLTQRRPFGLGGLRSEVTPLIWGVNARFGEQMLVDYVFEARVGQGSLLACCFRAFGEGNVAGRHMLREMINYAQGTQFRPTGPAESGLLRLMSQ